MTINIAAIFADEPVAIVAPTITYKPVTQHKVEVVPVVQCGAHNDPTAWTFTPDRYRRPGWRTAHCRVCGGFIGHQPPQG